jgi:hypothetical protein
MLRDTYRENLPDLENPMEAFAIRIDPTLPTNQQSDMQKDRDLLNQIAPEEMLDVKGYHYNEGIASASLNSPTL